MQTKEDKQDFKKKNVCLIVVYVKKVHILLKIEIIVFKQVYTEDQHIKNVIQRLQRNKRIFFPWLFIGLVIMIVIYCLENWLIRKKK